MQERQAQTKHMMRDILNLQNYDNLEIHHLYIDILLAVWTSNNYHMYLLRLAECFYVLKIYWNGNES